MIIYLSSDYVTFLSLNKKVTKEVSTGEALGANALNCGMLATGKHRYLNSLRGAPPSPVYPSRRTFESVSSSLHLSTDGRKSGHFRLVVKVFGPFVEGRGSIRGTACKKSPLYRLLFALFLPKQEKGRRNVSKVNDHFYLLTALALPFLPLLRHR